MSVHKSGKKQEPEYGKYSALVELTVHMNETGHYQDDNRKKDKLRPTSYSKPRKRAFQDMDKEDAQKVLKCMFCGDSFDSLQDLSPNSRPSSQ